MILIPFVINGLQVARSGLRVTGKKGIAHRVRHRSLEAAGGSKGLRVYMVDWLTRLNKLIE